MTNQFREKPVSNIFHRISTHKKKNNSTISFSNMILKIICNAIDNNKKTKQNQLMFSFIVYVGT